MKLAGAEIGAERPFFLIAGPCVVESAQLTFDVAGRLRDVTARLGIPFVFKASYDKANRSSRTSFRGPGIEAGLKVLADVKRQFGVPVLTDVHEDTPLAEVAAVVDVLTTKLLRAARETGVGTIAVAGGVACNSGLRAALAARAGSLKLVIPAPALCTDNAAMIARAGWEVARLGWRSSLELEARASLSLNFREPGC